MYGFASCARFHKETCSPFRALKHDVIHKDECSRMRRKKEGTWKLFLKQSTILSLSEMLQRMNVPTVLILNIDCLVLMGSIVNFNKINFILLFHRFIIILQGALGRPPFPIVRCYGLFGLAAFSLTSLASRLEPAHSLSITNTSTPHAYSFICFYMYISFLYFLKIIVLRSFPAFLLLAFR